MDAGVNFTIRADSESARRHFLLGLLLAWDFNRIMPNQALITMNNCLAMEPDNVMCHVGAALAVGPYLNIIPGKATDVWPVYTPQMHEQGYIEAKKAVELAQAAVLEAPAQEHHLAERELRYAEAMLERFSPDSFTPLKNRKAAELAFAQSMEAVGDDFGDATAYALAAEAMLNQCPWDFVNEDGRLRPESKEAERLLKKALTMEPMQPLALHLCIHLAEVAHDDKDEEETGEFDFIRRKMEKTGWGERCADALIRRHERMGHLLHMPSHLYIRVGRWHDAVVANVDAYEADVSNSRYCLDAYLPEHNAQMLVYAAGMSGEYGKLKEWSNKMWSLRETVKNSAWPGRERTNLLLEQVRRGMHDEVLYRTPPPKPWERGPGDPGGYQFAQAAWHFSRSMAFAAKGKLSNAKRELAEVERIGAAAPRDLHTTPGQGIGIYSPGYNDLTERMMVPMARARIAVAKKKNKDWSEAASLLYQAVHAEEGMGYTEPPRLLAAPMRHCLGYALIQAGKEDEAVTVYKEALRRHPGDGWALLGLAQALKGLKRDEEALEIQTAADHALRYADAPKPTHPCPSFVTSA